MGHQLLLPTSPSRLRKFYLDTTGCMKNGKLHRIGSSEAFGEVMAALMIVQSSRAFVFLGCSDPPRWYRLDYPFRDPLLTTPKNYHIYLIKNIELQKWGSSHLELASNIIRDYEFENPIKTKTLGVSWKSQEECFIFKIAVELKDSYSK
ncbi:hypothetical protein TNCV_986311 [Trichonephila clavipes]|uniref:Uncharacterized protein n=1 Tax=Trichonephila clavipes TaxID=2585209 RepID=A0A8X6SHM3_TRICX|nr:hypothetical protein TNCV_986311 [Trichonephila clavipes]